MTNVSQRTGVPTIRFDATLSTIDKWTILRMPEKASGKLPSRGQVAVQGTINGHGFQTVLEPDGRSGHWMRIDGTLQRTAALSAGDTATLEIASLKDWPEPNVPQDLETALAAALKAAVRCSFPSILIQWPEWPSGSNTVWNPWPLIVPRTATCPRDGSFPLAFSGKRKIVHLSIVDSVASKRIVGTPVR